MDRRHLKFSPSSKLKHALGATLLSSAFILYIYGISAPIVRITGGGPGPFEGQTGDHDLSLPGLLHLLLGQGDYVPLVCIFVFSFVIPLLKFALITATLVISACCRRWAYSVSLPLKIITALRVVAKYQLVDVFSTIILVSFINFVGVSAEPLFAAGAYQAYSLLSVVTTQWLCHCYWETLERRKLTECCGRFHVALCSPLLPSCMRTSMLGDIACSGCTTQVNLSEDSTAFPGRRLPMFSFPASAENPQSSGFHCCSQCLRQRASAYAESLSLGGSHPTSVNLSPEFSTELPGYTPLPGAQPANRGIRNIPVRGNDGVSAVWASGTRRPAQVAYMPASLSASPRRPCIRGGRFADESPHSLARFLGNTSLDEPIYMSSAFLRSALPKCCFSECLLRLFFLACSFCISAFAALICWVRPVLQLDLVPGKQRGFVIETSVMSLGDVFWRLYSVGHLWNGCLILVVFPLIATFILYVASIGTMASACIVYWAARSSDQAPECPIPVNVSERCPNCTGDIPQKAMRFTKTLSSISSFVGDIAMPDVQSVGLLTCYLIASNIDFLGARLPERPPGQPASAVERLFWNFSGFWAVLALGLSAAQVHRLAVPFEGVCQDMHVLFHEKNTTNNPCLSLLLRADPEPPLNLLGDSRGDHSGPEIISDGAAVDYPPVVTAPTEHSDICNFSKGSRRSRSPSFGLILHGCVRICASVALLLPIWLKPTDTMDVDLGLVNKQLQGFTEYMNPLLEKVLPQSFGDCSSDAHVAPPPCAGSRPLAYIRTKVYEATARWATGLNTTELQTVRFEATPKDRIVLTIKGKIKSLSLSLRIGGCFYGEDPGRCPVLWDGTDGCCGEDIKFMLQMSVRCNSSFPYLDDASFLRTHVSRLVVKEKVLGIFPVEVADITQIVEDQLSKWARALLDPKNRWIHWKNGTVLSVIDLLNVLLDVNAPAGIRCPSA